MKIRVTEISEGSKIEYDCEFFDLVYDLKLKYSQQVEELINMENRDIAIIRKFKPTKIIKYKFLESDNNE